MAMAPSVSHNGNTEEPLAETSTTPTVTQAAPFQTRTDGRTEEPPRPQAEPLPRKRGEIGFQEGVHDVPDANPRSQASNISTSLFERHPADRDNLPVSHRRDASSPSDSPRSPSRAESTDTTTTANTTGKRSLISFLSPKRIPTIGGLRLTTLAIFLFQLSLIGGTLAGWVLIIKHMQSTSGSTSTSLAPPSNTDRTDNDGTSPSVVSTTSAQIFVHVAFGIATLVEVIFTERSLFRLRAERYAHVHPGEVLPRTRGAPRERTVNMGFAPWNRPPLPTYAAALAQSGLGTGDVEDNIIAIPPPPAYGNTRGSRLLLRGFLSDALRAQRPSSNGSMHSRSSVGTSRGVGGEEDRPKSYMSTDPEWEARCDADRVLVLEETLARLEEGSDARRDL